MEQKATLDQETLGVLYCQPIKLSFMNKNVIKIGVPILVLGGIIAIIAATQKPIEQLSSDLRIEKLDFSNYVDKYISDSISGKPNSEAMQGYVHLYEIISTESSVFATTKSGHQQLLDAQDAEDCYERAFSAYFTIFGVVANRLFSNPTWNENELVGIKNTAQSLLTRNGTQSASDSLRHFIEYVNGYYAAVKLISQSRYCSSASYYNNYCNKARDYSIYPYSNNSRLKTIVSDVSENARTGWRNSITNTIDGICSHEGYYYNSYDEFYQGDYQSAYNKIKEYNSTFNTTWGSDLKTKLDNKNAELKDYFSNNSNNQ